MEETVFDCAKQCSTSSACKAYEYEKTSKTCRKAVHDIGTESKKDKKKEGWRTCVKVAPLDCDTVCGCGWYFTTKNLAAPSDWIKVANAANAKVCPPDFSGHALARTHARILTNPKIKHPKDCVTTCVERTAGYNDLWSKFVRGAEFSPNTKECYCHYHENPFGATIKQQTNPWQSCLYSGGEPMPPF